MTQIVFYRHERADNGVRTGIEVNGVSLFESFLEGAVEPDPALLWYIDLEFEGDTLPDTGDGVRQWLVEESENICRTLSTLADKVAAGFDPELRPFRSTMRNWSGDATFTVTASAVDRIAARGIGQKLKEIAHQWKDTLTALEPLVSV